MLGVRDEEREDNILILVLSLVMKNLNLERKFHLLIIKFLDQRERQLAVRGKQRQRVSVLK